MHQNEVRHLRLQCNSVDNDDDDGNGDDGDDDVDNDDDDGNDDDDSRSDLFPEVRSPSPVPLFSLFPPGTVLSKQLLRIAIHSSHYNTVFFCILVKLFALQFFSAVV